MSAASMERIRACRKEHGYTQAQIARLLGIAPSTYSKYETGKNDMPIQHLIPLALLYHTSIDYLIFRTDQPSPWRLRE